MLSRISTITSSHLKKQYSNSARSLSTSSGSGSEQSMPIIEVEIIDDGYKSRGGGGGGAWKTYGDISNYQPGKFVIQTFNKISPIGLKEFDDALYTVKAAEGDAATGNPHAILLRSHKLKEEEVPTTVRAIAR